MRRALLIPVVLLFVTAAAPRPSSAAVIGGPIGAPVVFRPKPGTTLSLDGRGPLHGSIEVRREGAGLTIINELSVDDYVAGVREVPGRWPMEALRAQAVAARTYALWERDREYWQRYGFDICGSVSCQVYQGANAEADERGRRWLEAVRTTAGEALLFEGKPALARYHASSGGRTLSNEVVYPSSGPRPYLRSVDDPADRVSPLHRWKVAFTRARLQQILHAAIGLNGTLSQVLADENARRVTIRTLGGSLEMSSVRFRQVVSAVAPRIFPSAYPGTRADGKPMPQTLPSSRFTVERTADGFVVNGRGYGHGVGMSQWGAMGRAQDGQSYDDILAAYYSGLRPQRTTHSPMIRVSLARREPAGRVSADGAFSVSTGGQTLAASTLGGWTVAVSGERSLQVVPPQGYALPLVLTGVQAPREQFVDPPKQGGTLDVSFVVPKPTQVSAVLTRETEEVAHRRAVVEAGERRLEVPLDPGELERRGTYRLTLRAFDGTKTVEESRNVVLVRPSSDLPLKAGAATVFALAAYVVWRRRRRARNVSR